MVTHMRIEENFPYDRLSNANIIFPLHFSWRKKITFFFFHSLVWKNVLLFIFEIVFFKLSVWLNQFNLKFYKQSLLIPTSDGCATCGVQVKLIQKDLWRKRWGPILSLEHFLPSWSTAVFLVPIYTMNFKLTRTCWSGVSINFSHTTANINELYFRFCHSTPKAVTLERFTTVYERKN